MTPSSRHRASQYDAFELVEICVKDMEYEKTGILRRNLRNILGDYKRCLNLRYNMKADGVNLLFHFH